jgi:hypothetical protein
VKGKWAAGIVPRHFTWIIKDRLSISERLGGYGANHRKVRRQGRSSGCASRASPAS